MRSNAGAFVATRLAAAVSRAAVLGAVAFATAAASCAHAEEIGGLRDMNLHVYGRLDEHCELGKIDDVDFGDLTVPGKRRASRVDLDCNVPINVKISAAHGALANDRYPQGQGPYAGSVAYDLGVQIPVRHPWEHVVTHQFESRDLIGAGQTFNTEDGIAVDGMRLDVALEPPTGSAGLLAGSYAETIEITVTPS